MIIKATGEDFDSHWGFIDWKGKAVLDIGADFGSTAECFLAKGATKVYAAEGDEKYYNQLVENIKNNPNIIPNKTWIGGEGELVTLFVNFKPDIVKMDCEGAEIHIVNVQDHIIRSIKEYAIEAHSLIIADRIIKKLVGLNYQIIQNRILLGEISVIHAIRR